VTVLGWVALAVVVAISFIRKERIGPVWLAAVGYAIACQIPIYLMRSSRFTALELAQTLRYLPDLVVVLALLLAVGLCAPNRVRSGVVGCLADAGGGNGLRHNGLRCEQPVLDRDVSSPAGVTTRRNRICRMRRPDWRERRPHRARRCSIREVDPLVLQRVAFPENLASHMFALLRDRPEFAGATSELRMLDVSGHVVDAKVTWVRSMVPGPEPQCGYLVQPDLPVSMRLDGPLLPADWTAEINYLANSDGSMAMSLSEGTETRVPVRPGLNRVFVRLSGAGDAIKVRAEHGRVVGVYRLGAGRIRGASVARGLG